MAKEHLYQLSLEWTGIKQGTTESYTSYSREYAILCEGKEKLLGSSDPAFRGDPKLHNPEDLLVASLAACHMLWYLHLCSTHKIHVLSYKDNPQGKMVEDMVKGGHFSEIVLHPTVVIKQGQDRELAAKLHEEAHHKCFIANSINFPVRTEPTILWQ